MDKRVALYLRLDSLFFQTTVRSHYCLILLGHCSLLDFGIVFALPIVVFIITIHRRSCEDDDDDNDSDDDDNHSAKGKV